MIVTLLRVHRRSYLCYMIGPGVMEKSVVMVEPELQAVCVSDDYIPWWENYYFNGAAGPRHRTSRMHRATCVSGNRK